MKSIKQKHCFRASFIAVAMTLAPLPAMAEVTAEGEVEAPTDDEKTEGKQDIVVVGTRMRGSVETDVPPTDTLDEAEITALGASSLTEVLAAVAPQTGSGRGRGGGPPVILLNGQRIANFRELRDLPPEAIKQVQIFPEQVALQYGFRPDQRVVNFILKDNFASFSAETDYSIPEKGGFDTKEFENTLTRIGPKSRFNLDIEFESRSRLTEDERGVISSATNLPFALGGNVTGLIPGSAIDPALNALTGQNVTVAAVPANTTLAGFTANANRPASGDIAEYRTLLPSQQRLSVNGSWSRQLGPQTNVSLNAAYEQQDQQSLIGLPFASLTVPASSPFTPFSGDVQLNRYFNTPRPLTRNSGNQSLQFGAGFNTLIKDWRLALTADYDINKSKNISQINADFSALRSAISAGSANPYAANLGSDLLFGIPDTSETSARPIELRGTLTGKPLMLPAGPVLLTLRTAFDRKTFDTSSSRRGVVTDVSLRRNNTSGAINLQIPLVERGTGALGGIGDLSANANYGLTDVSDVGTIKEYGAGLDWSPIESLSISASIIGDENAPSLSQLGNPLIVTPNVAVFDFTRGESRFVELVSGGNPLLISESRRDFKISADWKPKFIKDLSLQLEYFQNRSSNTTAAFPLLTPEIEAAFPGRVTRDASGQLIRVDQRPVNFAREKSQRIRLAFNISGTLGKQPQGMGGFGGFGGFPGGGRPPAAGAPPSASPPAGTPQDGRPASTGSPPASGTAAATPPAGGAPGGGRPPGAGGGGGRGPMGMMMSGGPSRWSVSLAHTIRLQDEIIIGPGVPTLDLLNGSATSSLGGSPRHELVLSGGIFHKGMGFRLEGNYRSATRVDGNSLTGTGDLRFGDLASLNAFFFVSLDQRGNLTKKYKWLKGSRIALRIENLLGDVINVRDASGAVPLSYQPGLLDPQGRVFELSFRKRF
jgi:iron complex outermembrane recepter protein